MLGPSQVRDRLPSARQKRCLVIPILVVVSLMAAGCGTRLSGDQLVQARAGGVGAQGGVTTEGGPDAALGVEGAEGGAVDTAGTDLAAGGGAAAGGDSTGAPGTAGSSDAAGAAAAGAQKTTGGGEQGSGTSGTSGGGGAALTASGSPIVLGTVGTFSGPSGAAWKPGAEAIQVWAKDVNRRGGVDGHPIKLLVADDGGDPARHLSLVKDMVENKKVFAFVANVESTAYSKAGQEYLESKQIPVVGGDVSSQFWETSSVYFPQGTTQSNALLSHMAAAREQQPKIKKIALLTCREAAGCKEAAEGWAPAAKTKGFEVVYTAEVSIAQPDFTSECLNARNAGAEMIFVAVDPNSVRRLAGSCGRQNYKPVYVLPSAVINSDQKGDPNLENAIGISSNSPWMSSATPGQAEWRAALKRYAPKAGGNLTSTYGWGAGKMFEAAAKGRLGATPDRAKLFEGLYSFRNETLGGIAPPLTFEKGKRKTAACWFTLSFKGGAWKEASGGRASCP